MKRLFALCLLLALSGCMTMPDIKVKGVDNLRVVEHVLPTQEQVVEICAERLGYGKIASMLVSIVACATVTLETWSCDIYYSKWGLRHYPEVLAHERMHCDGWWHDDSLQTYYDNWKKENGK